MTNTTCSVEDCEGAVKTRGWCQMHYFRWRRDGDPGDATRRKRDVRNPHCSVEGCDKPDKDAGLCAMHGARKRRHGDPHIVIAPEFRKTQRADRSPVWVGSAATYSAVHERLRIMRGPAPRFMCDHCGAQAKQWAYDHADPCEVINDRGLRYSVNLDHYTPLCVPCHKVMDLAIISSRKGAR